jgi:hypothetical protein
MGSSLSIGSMRNSAAFAFPSFFVNSSKWGRHTGCDVKQDLPAPCSVAVQLLWGAEALINPAEDSTAALSLAGRPVQGNCITI